MTTVAPAPTNPPTIDDQIIALLLSKKEKQVQELDEWIAEQREDFITSFADDAEYFQDTIDGLEKKRKEVVNELSSLACFHHSHGLY